MKWNGFRYLTANGTPCDEPAASQVLRDRFPSWFSERLRRVVDPYDRTDDFNLLVRLMRKACDDATWIDHEGTTLIDGHELFVSEPYLSVEGDFSCVQEFAKRFECELFIANFSYWLPGKTIRLTFRPKGSDWFVELCPDDQAKWHQRVEALETDGGPTRESDLNE